MALQATGAISLDDIQTEFGGANPVSLSEYYSAAVGIPASGAIAIGTFYGKSSLFAFAITSSITNGNLHTLAISAGWDGSSILICTINAGVVISGNTAGNSTAAMTINGSFPSGVTLINNGQIRGRGGAGGNATTRAGQPGGAGGRALRATVPVSVNNSGNIWAGGGGGGAGGNASKGGAFGGGGGGRSSNVNSVGGLGAAGGNAGGAGKLAAYGAGGVNPAASTLYFGGRGGHVGAAGVAGNGAAGAAGQAVNGNSNITWIATGSRLGTIT